MADIELYKPIKVWDTNRNDLSLVLAKLIGRIALVANFKVDQQQMDIMLEEMPKVLQERYKLLELPELKIAFENGVYGHYGDYYGISTVTLVKWLKGYVDSGAHQVYMENKVKTLATLIPEKAPPTQQEIDDIIRKGIVKCFTDYQTTGEVIDYGSPKIDWLLKNGIINPTKFQREEYKAMAREELLAEAYGKKESINKIDRYAAKREIEEILTANDDNLKIQALAKSMCLRDWFESLMENGNDINELIK